MSDKIRAHIWVSGRVQGVFFRANTKDKAGELGVTGWVRNLPDSRVEAIFEGEKEKVEKMVDWTREGPAVAKVERFDLIWENYKGEFDGFSVK